MSIPYRSPVLKLFLLAAVLHVLQHLGFVLAEVCKARPLYLPIRNVSTSVGSEMTLGIALSIGTPPQHVALHPSLMINSTFVPRYISSDTGCYNVSSQPRTPCIARYGGGFHSADSSTWTTNPNNVHIGSASYDRRFTEFSNWTAGYDTLRLEDVSNLEIKAMPLVVPKNEFGPFSNSPLGLAESSVFTSALEASSIIPSRSWGLGPSGLCLGCIDNSAINGTFISQPVGKSTEKNCALPMNIVNVAYQPSNGGAEVKISTGTFTACVEPGAQSLILPQSIINAYVHASGADLSSSSYSYFSKFYLGKSKPDGVLVFTIAGELKVSVTLSPSNDSYYWYLPFGVGGWGNYEIGTFVLGAPFIEKIYLKYDDAARTYSIAGANTGSTSQDIQAIGCQVPPDATLSGTSGFSIGAIVGTAVGGVLGATLMTLIGCWFWWRKQRSRLGSRQVPPVAAISYPPQLVGNELHEANGSSSYVRLNQELPA
ncbi:hypothetical protein H2198_002038 [Neophaeococcomyces mojaviensis]|uniref:Uncharacterized protein n=1 Tax=Neophaeococcomyces mojaviensis TaxID=3383035 RepID=A0ACC3AFT6_9EURO|nr:hypothetical protein H2198_002038 [Knufia sp. JES_112]